MSYMYSYLPAKAVEAGRDPAIVLSYPQSSRRLVEGLQLQLAFRKGSYEGT